MCPVTAGSYVCTSANNELSIKIAGRGELMNSRVHDSENTLPACVFMTHC